jgi:hypothetical protein
MLTDTMPILRWQFGIAWRLADEVHLPRLTDEMCLWRPQPDSATVRQGRDAVWLADWTGTDSLDPCPPTIAWLTWHVIWWWSNALAVFGGDQPVEPTQVSWPGSAESAVAELRSIAHEWRGAIEHAHEEALSEVRSFPWPDPRPLIYLVAWVNVELMKNVAEIGEVANMFANRRG